MCKDMSCNFFLSLLFSIWIHQILEAFELKLPQTHLTLISLSAEEDKHMFFESFRSFNLVSTLVYNNPQLLFKVYYCTWFNCFITKNIYLISEYRA